MSTLTLEPLISPSALAALTLLSAALLGGYALRRPAGLQAARWAGVLTLMACSLAAVLFVLLNPTWLTVRPPPAGKPRLAILVDASGSMATRDAADGRSRYLAACDAAGRLSAACAPDFDVQVASFAEGPVAANLRELSGRAPDGRRSDLAAALRRALSDDQPQGQAVVLVSDGIQNADAGVGDVLDAARLAKSMAVPIYTLTLGRASAATDLAVELRTSQEVAFAEQETPIEASITHRGWEGVAEVVLSRDGRDLDRRSVSLSGDSAATVRFSAAPKAVGLHQYEVRVEPAPGETTIANNSAPFVLRVVNRPIRVLMLEGKPYWDAKFLMRTLTTDPVFELESVTRIADGRFLVQHHARRAASQPAASRPGDERASAWRVATDAGEVLGDARRLNDFQIVLLGRESREFLSEPAVAGLRRWIAEQGGALVCYRGSPEARVTERMAQLLPVRVTPSQETRFHPRPTESGIALGLLPGAEQRDGADALSELPSLASDARLDGLKPAAVVIALSETSDGRQSPAQSCLAFGAGRIAYIEGAGMWRWAFLPPDRQTHDLIYGGLWRRLLSWLVSSTALPPGERMALRSDKIVFAEGEPAVASLFIRLEATPSEPPAVELLGSGLDSPRTFVARAVGDEPGSYRVVFGELPEGRYDARIVRAAPDAAACAIKFEVRGFTREQLDLAARPDLLRQIASDSGGAVLGGDAARDVKKQFGDHLLRSRKTQVLRTPAWDRWWALVSSFALWGASWGLRRWSGLI